MNTIEMEIAALRALPHYGMEELLQVMRILRSEHGCPWDREQDHTSIRAELIEECYEAVEAIDAQSVPMMREELGDVLLQVIFHCQIEAEQSHFTFDDIVDELCRKLIERHPHVFGDVSAENIGEALNHWDAVKQETKHQQTYTDTLEGVCKALPALMYAQKLGKRAGRAGMDWESAEAAFPCIEQETKELAEAMQQGDHAQMEAELGDLLFSCVNVARKLGLDAETALRTSSEKFLRRFAQTEALVTADGKEMPQLSLEILDTYWEKAKEIEATTKV